MKKFYFLLTASLFSFLIMATSANAQPGASQWSFSNPKPFGFNGEAISYADDNNALVAGVNGGIAKTTDGGGTWAYMVYVTTIEGEVVKPTFNDVQFLNTSTAFAVGTNGVMIKSIDGGANWTALTTPFSADHREINTAYFMDENTGYIGGRGDLVTNKPTLYKTVNGGSTWQAEYEFPAPAYEWYEGAVYKVRFTASGVGYVGGANGLVWKYENAVWSDYSITPSIIYTNMDVNEVDTVITDYGGGYIDTAIYDHSDDIFGLDEQNYRGIAIVNDTVVVVSAQNNGALIRINTSDAAGSYRMLNNGSAYRSKYSPLGSPQIYNLICRDGSTIAGAAEGGRMIISNDKAYSWESRAVYPSGSQAAEAQFFGVDISPAGRIGLCGAGGVIADSLTAWRLPYINGKWSGTSFLGGYSVECISFADADNGIAAGSSGTMLRTQNGGGTWEDISNPGFAEYDSYTALSYISPTVLYAAASNGMLYKSADKGTSFDLVFSEATNGRITGMHFINEDSGWAVSNNMYTDMNTYISTFHSIIYRTTDGGLTWDSSATVFPSTEDYSLIAAFNDIKFLNRNVGYAVGALGTIYKSTDGGVTWVKQDNIPASAAATSISSISIVDENVAFVSGLEGLVMKTVNGGASWQFCNTGLPGGYTRYDKILMQDAAEGMVFANGNVYTTANGGIGWSVFYAPVNSPIKAACFAPMVGCGGGLCKKVYAGMQFAGNILKFDADVVLPVKFSNLTGTGTSAGNQLFWTAFAQEEVSYFEIQHSTDGTKFNKIGDKVYPGSLSYESYKWLDVNAGAGKNFYRIKAVEKSGAVFYTNVVLINTKRTAHWDYAISNGGLVLNNVKVQQGNITATLVNTAGQVIGTKSWKQDGGAFNQVLLLPPAAKGVCFVKIDNEGATYSFKILIQ